MKIRSLLLLGSLSFFLLVAAIFVASLIILQKKQGDALIVNLAGRQRMLSQKMSKEALLYNTHTSPSNREKLRSTIWLFSRTHSALLQGGLAALNLDGSNQKKIPAPSNLAFIKQLKRVGNVWKRMEKGLQQLLSANGKSKAALAVIIKENPLLLQEMNKAVGIRQKASEQKNSWNLYVQITALIIGFILIIFALIIGNRIGNSLVILTEAAEKISLGDTDEPIELKGIGEIAALSQAFERMRKSTQKALQALDNEF